MAKNSRFFIVNGIKLPIDASFEEAFSIAKKRLSRLGVRVSISTLRIYKRSIDARHKNDIKLIYSIAAPAYEVNISNEKLSENGVTLQELVSPEFKQNGAETLTKRPLIVGAGPSGLFAALILAEAGYRPIIIERGSNIEKRKLAYEKFKKYGVLDENSNVQFGAGGAGTFSDGKLITRIGDSLSDYVLRKFVEFGAPEDIIYSARPHIGTDILSEVVDKMIRKIEALGGTVMYDTTYISSENNIAVTTGGQIEYGLLILAIGHSARDTYKTLIDKGYSITAKPFSVGMRIEHLAKDIDDAMYGSFAGHKALGHAEYNLSYNTKERGVYTFCMCPGGVVVPSSSEKMGLVVNGMSERKRDGINSNSAVVASIFTSDYGDSPIKAIEFQRNIEKAAFVSGGGDYSAPIITVGDFLSDKCITEPSKVVPSYRDGEKFRIRRPEEYLPGFVTEQIKLAIKDFDRKISGFATSFAILTGAETRTSSPVRILRDLKTRLAIGKDNVYPIGEGAGYAGGITSAAIDGIKTAIAVLERFKPSYDR